MKAVIADNLAKTYSQGKKAVDHISFTLEQGEVFGFLGPNGAGKTTTVKLLNGMLVPTGGSCRVFDIDPAEEPERMHRFSGVVTEHAQMYGNLTGYENLVFYGSLFGISGTQSRRRALDLLEQLELTEAKDRKLDAYSTGMRQRLSLARAMIHSPKILFLDEPTSGLDPESAMSVNNRIKSLAKDEGTTIFLCTHQLRYAQEICSSYGLIDEGALLAAGSIDRLRSLVFSGMKVVIQADFLPKDVTSVKIGEDRYEVTVQSEEEIPPVVRHIVNNGGRVYHVLSHRLSLEEIYFSLLDRRKDKHGEANEREDVRND